MNWEMVRIDRIAERVTKGTTPTTYGMPFVENGINFVKAEALNGDSSLDHSGFSFITQETHERLSRSILHENDVLVTIAGANIGRCGIVHKPDLPANANQAVGIIRVLPHKADPRFVYYHFKLPATRQHCLNIGRQAAQPNVNLTNLKAFKLSLPPLAVQRKIADILSAYDELIEINQRRIALLEQAGREIYREWFVRLRFPGHERTKIVDGVPEAWERVNLSRLVSTQYGYTASASGEPVGPKFLRGTDINKRSYVDWATVPYCPEDGLDFEKYALKRGDLLVIRMADPGKVAIIEREIRAIFASYLVRLSVQKDAMIDPLYLFHVLAGAEYQGFMQAASAGSTRKSASAKLLTNFNVLRPPETIQTRFVDQIRPMREMIGALLDQNSRASMARDLLLPRLMSGQLMV